MVVSWDNVTRCQVLRGASGVAEIRVRGALGRDCLTPLGPVGRLEFTDPEHQKMEVRMDLARIVINETSDQQIIVLRERAGDRQFPIVIGLGEAYAVDRRVKNIPTPRPLTHELLSNVIRELHGELEKIIVHDLRDHTFYAKLVIRQSGELIEVDSRPSDAIALGVANDTEIYVEEHVLQQVCETPDA